MMGNGSFAVLACGLGGRKRKAGATARTFVAEFSQYPTVPSTPPQVYCGYPIPTQVTKRTAEARMNMRKTRFSRMYLHAINGDPTTEMANNNGNWGCSGFTNWMSNVKKSE